MNTVVFTVCQRPEYFSKVLDSWKAVRGLDQWRLIFMIEPTDRVREQTAIIDGLRHPNKQLIFNATRLGVLVNPFEGLSKAFDTGAHFTVLAEEDIIVSSDILEFFWSAARYATWDTIAVCAHSKAGEEADPYAIGRTDTFSPWVWGTDVRVWNELLKPTWDKDYSSGEGGVEAGWDWNIHKRVIPSVGGHVIAPHASRSDNIGQFGGVHQQPHEFSATRSRSFQQERPYLPYRFVL